MKETLPAQKDMVPTSVPSARSARTHPFVLRLMIAVLLLVGVLQVVVAWSEIVSSGMDIQQDYVAAQRLLAGEDIAAGVAVLICGFVAIALTLWRQPIEIEQGARRV